MNLSKTHFRIGRRVVVAAALGLALGSVATSPVMAQPDKPMIKVLVGFPPGAGTDTLARIYAEALGDLLGATTVVENKPGAGGQIAAQAMKTATPDSNMLMMTVDHQVVMLPITLKVPGFDVKKDLVPVGRIVNFYTCLAVPGSSPVRNFQDYVEAVRKNPEAGNFGIPAPGSQPQFVGYVIGKQYNVKTTPIPYRGAAPAISDLVGGQVQSAIVPCDAMVDYHKAGKVRVLAMASETRYKLLPEVPTFGELGMKMPADSFLGVYAAASMKPEMLQRVVAATAKMLQDPKIAERIASTRMETAYASPDELRRITEKSTEFWGEQVRLSNFQLQ